MTRTVSRSTVVAAPPAEVFAVLADPHRHPEIDGTGTVRGVVDGPDRLTLGATFAMSMRQGMPYTTHNTVVEYDPERRIAWRHRARHLWRYELRAVPGGTEVTETFDYSAKRLVRLVELIGMPKMAATALESTLAKLAARW